MVIKISMPKEGCGLFLKYLRIFPECFIWSGKSNFIWKCIHSVAVSASGEWNLSVLFVCTALTATSQVTSPKQVSGQQNKEKGVGKNADLAGAVRSLIFCHCNTIFLLFLFLSFYTLGFFDCFVSFFSMAFKVVSFQCLFGHLWKMPVTQDRWGLTVGILFLTLMQSKVQTQVLHSCLPGHWYRSYNIKSVVWQLWNEDFWEGVGI